LTPFFHIENPTLILCESYARKVEGEMLYGYARVSTDGQSLAAQDGQDLLNALDAISRWRKLQCRGRRAVPD
jgi:hypothetical protein